MAETKVAPTPTSDVDPIEAAPKPSNFINSTVDAVGKIRIKFILLLFIMFVFISSDVFAERVLGNFGGAVDVRTPTNFGVIIQGIFLVLGYVILEILSDQSII